MSLLIAGLIVFLGAHSLRLFADGWRTHTIARMGVRSWKVVYSIVSIAGFVLIIWGFGLARQQPVLLYTPLAWLKDANALFTLVAFVLLFAAHAPPNHFKEKLGHPMVASVKVWAFGHLLSTGFLHDVILFGAFLLWAIVNFAISRRRDRLAGVVYAKGTLAGDAVCIALGLAVWAIFAFWLHARWIGVSPFRHG